MACVLLCVGALSAGCAPDSPKESPSIANEPQATASDPSNPEDAVLPTDTATPASDTSTPTSSPPSEEQGTAVQNPPVSAEQGTAVPNPPVSEEPSVLEEPAAAEEPSLLEEPAAAEEPAAGDAPVSASARDELQAEVFVFPALGDEAGVARWTVEIVEWRPHDPDAFTQGLEVADNTMYESTGHWGQSSLRTVHPTTGEVIALVALSDDHFGEGLTVVGEEIIQLTWQSGTAIVYDRRTLQTVRQHGYEGEGWGLCAMDDVLIMSDGSDRLARRDPQTFELLGTVTVTASGYEGRLDHLNELECVEGMVIANVWQTEQLLVIDPESGRVVAAIDARPLVDDVRQNSSASDIDVLNGVALDESSGTLWMTGKLWPRLYRVRIVEVP